MGALCVCGKYLFECEDVACVRELCRVSARDARRKRSKEAVKHARILHRAGIEKRSKKSAAFAKAGRFNYVEDFQERFRALALDEGVSLSPIPERRLYMSED